MATCKDCLHIDVCYMVEHYGVDIEEDRQEYDCHEFKAKANCEEVVRCKDCDYYEKEHRGFGFCKYFDIGRADNDFCSSCIRRDGE